MAEDEDGVSNRKSAQNSNNGGSSQDNEQSRTDLPYFPRLLTPETDEAKCNNSENGDASPAEAKSSSSKSSGSTRKDENPFSFRHFLKRDLSLPGNSTYESTGARPKVYASTVQHSPTRPAAPRRAPLDPQAKEKSADGCDPHASDNTSSSSSVEVSFSVVDNSESKHNLYTDNSDAQFYRPGPEPLAMPSLPDFVQDHILVEQAYLNSNGPILVDLDNLPDFTFNTNYNAGTSSSLGRRHNSGYGGGRGVYGPYSGASTSGEPDARAPLDLPPGAEGAPAPDLQLSLDLTESVNPADRRNMSPRTNTFPLDLPPNAGAESMRLPDFLPLHPTARASPEPEPRDAALPPLRAELERTRSELYSERARRARLEAELEAARAAADSARAAADSARAAADTARAAAHTARRAQHDAPRARAGSSDASGSGSGSGSAHDNASRESPESESTVGELKTQIRRLKEELAASQAEVRALRGRQAGAAADLRSAADVAESELRDLLAGLERLRSLSAALEPA